MVVPTKYKVIFPSIIESGLTEAALFFLRFLLLRFLIRTLTHIQPSIHTLSAIFPLEVGLYIIYLIRSCVCLEAALRLTVKVVDSTLLRWNSTLLDCFETTLNLTIVEVPLF